MIQMDMLRRLRSRIPTHRLKSNLLTVPLDPFATLSDFRGSYSISPHIFVDEDWVASGGLNAISKRWLALA